MPLSGNEKFDAPIQHNSVCKVCALPWNFHDGTDCPVVKAKYRDEKDYARWARRAPRVEYADDPVAAGGWVPSMDRQRQTAKHVYPAPEIVRDGAWKISECPEDAVPTTDIRAKRMRVPLDERDVSAWIRRHEMAHARWSPRDVPSADKGLTPYILALEDARVNRRLQRAGLDTNVHMTDDEILTRMAGQPSPTLQALLRASLHGTPNAITASTLLPADHEGAVQAALRIIEASDLHFSGVLEAARALRAALPPLPPGTNSSSSCCLGHIDDEKLRDFPEVDDVLIERLGMIDSYASSTLPNPFAKPSYSGVQWGVMRIEVPAMPVRLGAAVGRAKWRPADAGAHPRRMERWTSDQAVFSSRGRRRGGTVLIDVSGSMQLSAEDIERCLLSAPAATIAMYSSEKGHARGGVLTVLAQRGRRVKTIQRHGGGNVVDGPALRWLGTQKSPRLWVCDGNVTGVGDNTSLTLTREAAGICRTFGIRRVGIETAAKLLRGR